MTNYSVNKSSDNFNKNISTVDECIGSKWSLSALRNYFKERNLSFENLWKKINDIVIKAIILNADETISQVRKLTDKRNNLFEMYGFDIILDSDLNPWLLEINLNPSLNCDTELDIKIKTNLMTDILNIIGLVPYSHKERRLLINKTVIDPKTLEEEIHLFNKFLGAYKNQNTNNEENHISNNEDKKELIMNSNNNLESTDISVIKNNLRKEQGNKILLSNSDGSLNKIKKEKIKKEYFENKTEFNLRNHFDNYPNELLIQGILNYTNEEFSRNKNFKLLFPLRENCDYYSQFILNPEIENIILWSLIKDNLIYE